MKLSRREIIMGAATGTVLLFGVSAVMVKSRLEEWKDLREKQAELQAQIDRHSSVVARRPQWEAEFSKLKGMMPVHPAEKNMGVTWLFTMDNLAQKNGVKILKRQAEDEKLVGDVYELPIKCREWEGSLPAVVHFLFDLQSEGAMLDVRELQIKPKAGDVFRGHFSLYCAYGKERKKPHEGKGKP